MKAQSILNDVLGPVMTGPSSSHTAAPGRIGLAVAALWGRKIKKAIVVYDIGGSYPGTHVGQGSDFGFAGGLQEIPIDSLDFRNSIKLAEQNGVEISFQFEQLNAEHPNTARIDVYESNSSVPALSVMSVSTGGGAFELTELDGFPISFDGQNRKAYLYCADQSVATSILLKLKKAGASSRMIEPCRAETTSQDMASSPERLLEIEADSVSEDILASLESVQPSAVRLRLVEALFPNPLKLTPTAPFATASEALEFAEAQELGTLHELAMHYELGLGTLGTDRLDAQMVKLHQAMKVSTLPPPLDLGVTNLLLPNYAAQLLEWPSLPFDMGAANPCMASSVAVMENSCAHRIIVAAPTAGSAGVIPGTIVAIGERLNKTDKEVRDALWASGLVGAFIANQATFGAEVAGCQAEIGAAACMAAAGLVSLAGGSISEAFHAAALAMQSMLGLICDPIAGLTEVPCIQRNVNATAVAVFSANMALCGMVSIIPLDEVIHTMLQVGNSLPSELRCTCEGGLCATKTGRMLAEQIKVDSKL